MQKGFVAKMVGGKTFEKVKLPEIARESGCHYVVNCTVSKPNLVEKVIKNAIHVAREIGPTYLQLYTPCILEIGKNSMEGLQEMRDSAPTERFAYKEYVSDQAKEFVEPKLWRQGNKREKGPAAGEAMAGTGLSVPDECKKGKHLSQAEIEYSHVGSWWTGRRDGWARVGHGRVP